MNPDNPQCGALTRQTHVGVIGAGTMGAGIAQVAAASGHQVLLFDQNPEAVARGVEQISGGLTKQVQRGKFTAEQRHATLARIHPVTELAALADCGLVIEAIIEDLAIKRALLASLEACCRNDCILASNTSSISITALGAEMAHPKRLLGMHFFNPAPVMKLVEVISGLATSTTVAEQVHATANAWGKQAVHAKSTPGFIVNRVARPFYAEALRLLEEGVADIASLDGLMKEAGRFRMGPFELMDLIGHDVNYAVTCSVFDAYYHDPRFKPSLTQKALVECSRLGRKSGRGFYDYDANDNYKPPTAVLPAPRPAYLVPQSIRIHGDLGIATPLIARAQASGISVTRLNYESNTGFIQLGNSRLHLTDGRFASERAAVDKYAELALFDLAFDFATTTRLAVTFADQSGPSTRDEVLGLFQALGISISELDDTPGLLLMRTLAMLANEAADTVNQGVCSALDADLAMVGGLNYPLGPLAWCERVGITPIFQCLQHLQQSYGEDRYRPSPLLRRLHFSGNPFHD
ncbi:MAG: 3-hydroxybutyryl-CoA dehydrogenase [Motiliproteus sp.]|jgi:3-hydroxybutyryl-CoA dehydrogenase